MAFIWNAALQNHSPTWNSMRNAFILFFGIELFENLGFRRTKGSPTTAKKQCNAEHFARLVWTKVRDNQPACLTKSNALCSRNAMGPKLLYRTVWP
jgi:hypothetical protein